MRSHTRLRAKSRTSQKPTSSVSPIRAPPASGHPGETARAFEGGLVPDENTKTDWVRPARQWESARLTSEEPPRPASGPVIIIIIASNLVADQPTNEAHTLQGITDTNHLLGTACVEFDHTGDYLATGDKGGRVVLFERNENKKGCEYKFYTEFQSHEPEFDYLKSLEIEEKINKIRWCKRQNAAHFLLSTNGQSICLSSLSFSRSPADLFPHRPHADKTIKLWKVFEKSLKVVAENNSSAQAGPNPPSPPPASALPSSGLPSSPSAAASSSGGTDVNGTPYLRLPRMTYHDTIVAAVPRKVYANAHAYHINSVSVNSDGETYMSADDLRINLWNLNISDQSFSASSLSLSSTPGSPSTECLSC